MHCEELMWIKVTFSKKPKVKGMTIWSLEQMPELRAAILRVSASGEAEFCNRLGSAIVYHVKPEYPLSESRMKEPRFKDYLRVYIGVYTQRATLGVKP